MRSTEKILLTSTSLLALTLGMGISPARADLIITTVSDTTLTPNGSTFTFGPASDPGGFTASITSTGVTSAISEGITPEFAAGFVDFNVSGSETNTVAVTSGCTADCTLATFSPGDTIDGSLTFASSGSLKIDGPDFSTLTGTDYFGLDDVVGGVSMGAPVTDPFGWLEITFNGDDTGTVDRYAFESDTGPAPIPEPASLSVLAVGAAAILAARRRRKQA